MKLSPQALQEFKKIYKAEFNENLTDPEAQEYGLRLLQMMELITRNPLSSDSFDNSDRNDTMK